MAKKLSRVSILDEETQSYTTAAYLIAQLGKNYSLPKLSLIHIYPLFTVLLKEWKKCCVNALILEHFYTERTAKVHGKLATFVHLNNIIDVYKRQA